MKTGKRIVSIFLVVLMLLTAAPLAGFVGLEIAPKAKALEVGDLIQFGVYPQTRVDETDALKSAADDATWVSYNYYCGTFSGVEEDSHDGNMRPGDWMQYADFYSDNIKYRAVKFTQYRPRNTGFQSLESYTYQKGNGYFTNNTYYFKFEPLTWRVLDPDAGLIMCDRIIDAQAFQNTSYYYAYEYYVQDGDDSKLANDYPTSSIHGWLNNTFCETAFTDLQKNTIRTVDLVNEIFETANWNGRRTAATSGKVFLLSYAETTNTSYGFSENATRLAQGTDYAYCQGCFEGYDNCTSWSLRTPGYTTVDFYDVNQYGGLGRFDTIDVNDVVGIRPACILPDLELATSGVVLVESIELSNNTTNKALIMADGDSKTIVATVNYWGYSNEDLVWKSSDESVVTVDQNGRVTAKREGIAFITARIGDYENIKAECKVIVRGYDSGVYSLGEETYSFHNVTECPEGHKSGHCHAMAVTSSMFHLGLLNKAKLGEGEKPLYDYVLSDTILEMLCDYQNLQGFYCIEACVAGNNPEYSTIMDIIGGGVIRLTDKILNWLSDGSRFAKRDWNQVCKYVESHRYDNKGDLFIAYDYKGKENDKLYGHTVSFLRYDIVNGEKRIYTYDSNNPNMETYLYEAADGSIRFYPYDDTVYRISLADIYKYFNATKDSRRSLAIYSSENNIVVENATASLMSGDIGDNSRQIMYELPDDVTQVRIAPLVDDAEFTYMNQIYHIHREDENTIGILTLAETEEDTGALTVINDPDNHVHIYTVELTAEPTCAENGEVTCTCTRCGDTYIESIDALGHYDSDDDSICDDCGTPMPIEEHTHDYTATVTTSATCTEPGEATYTCDCGDTYTETIPATGHVDDNNDGHCDACSEQMTGGDHCKFCGKIHNGGFFDKLTGFFHKIFAIFKR